MVCNFGQAPREDSYLLSELFHGRRVRYFLPSLDNTIDINKGKAAREMKDLVVKNATKSHKPLKALSIGDLCYRRYFDGKKTLRIESLCEVIVVRKMGESFYIRDLETERIYLRNCLCIKPSESSLNEIHKAKNLRIICDKSSSHQINKGNLSSTKVEVPHGCLHSKESRPPPKCVKFDNTVVLAWCELRCWRAKSA